MRRNLLLCTVLSVLATAMAAKAQETPKLAGTWDVTINNPEKTITEQWIVQQDGDKLTGTVKNASGQLPLTGTVDGTTVRVLVTNGDTQYQIHATVTGDSMDGTVRMGKSEYLWRAKKAKS